MSERPPLWRLPLLMAAGVLLVLGSGLAAMAWLRAAGPAIGGAQPSAEGRLPPLLVPAGSVAAVPWVAVIVRGVGLAEAPTQAALALPPAIALAFSPYARHLEEWRMQATAAGHELWVDLPLEPADPSLADAGERALRPQQDEAARLAGLDWALGGLPGAIGAVAAAGAFADQPSAFEPLARALAARGLRFVELGGRQLLNVVAASGAGHASAEVALDAGAVPEAMDRALDELAGQARRQGGAVAHVYADPWTLARLATWVHRARDRGLRLVPLGEVAKPAGNGSDAR